MTKDFGELIANASFGEKSIGLYPEKLIQWASKYYMPIYNDNRLLLRSFKNRMLVGEALKHEASKLNGGDPKMNGYDFVAGTSTAGIAPSTTFAFSSEVDLVISENNRLFTFDPYDVAENTIAIAEKAEGVDVIASTCPYAIPFGVDLANDRELPFMYVRQSKKKHGLQQQIEGIGKEEKALEGKNILLVDYNTAESYKENAIEAIEGRGGKVAGVISENIESKIACDSVSGRKGVVGEDLISTGGSSAGEVAFYRNQDAIIKGCVSIFNYGLDQALEMFEGKRAYNKDGDVLFEPCEVRSALTYNKMMDVAIKNGKLDEKGLALLKEWRAAPFDYGRNHGYPHPEGK